MALGPASVVGLARNHHAHADKACLTIVDTLTYRSRLPLKAFFYSVWPLHKISNTVKCPRIRA